MSASEINVHILFCVELLLSLAYYCVIDLVLFGVANGSNQTTDQDLLSHLIRSLACQSSEHGGKNLSGILHEPQNLLNNGALMGKSDLVSTFLSNGPQVSLRSSKPHDTIPISETPVQAIGRGGDTPAISSIKPSTSNSPPAYSEIRDSTVGQCKMMNFDLNDAYVDSDDGMEDIERQTLPVHMGTSSLECPSWVQQDSHQSSPPQTSGNSDSASAQSPSSSAGEAQVMLSKNFRPFLITLSSSCLNIFSSFKLVDCSYFLHIVNSGHKQILYPIRQLTGADEEKYASISMYSNYVEI